MGSIWRSVLELRLLILPQHDWILFLTDIFCIFHLFAVVDHRLWTSKPLFQTKNLLYMWVFNFMSQTIYSATGTAWLWPHTGSSIVYWLAAFKKNEIRTIPPLWPQSCMSSILTDTKLHLSNLSFFYAFLTRDDMSKRGNWRPSKSWTSLRSVNATLYV